MLSHDAWMPASPLGPHCSTQSNPIAPHRASQLMFAMLTVESMHCDHCGVAPPVLPPVEESPEVLPMPVVLPEVSPTPPEEPVVEPLSEVAVPEVPEADAPVVSDVCPVVLVVPTVVGVPVESPDPEDPPPVSVSVSVSPDVSDVMGVSEKHPALANRRMMKFWRIIVLACLYEVTNLPQLVLEV